MLLFLQCCFLALAQEFYYVTKETIINNSELQNWKRGKTTRNGYFTLENSFHEGKYLTNDLFDRKGFLPIITGNDSLFTNSM